MNQWTAKFALLVPLSVLVALISFVLISAWIERRSESSREGGGERSEMQADFPHESRKSLIYTDEVRGFRIELPSEWKGYVVNSEEAEPASPAAVVTHISIPADPNWGPAFNSGISESFIRVLTLRVMSRADWDRLCAGSDCQSDGGGEGRCEACRTLIAQNERLAISGRFEVSFLDDEEVNPEIVKTAPQNSAPEFFRNKITFKDTQ